MACDRQPSISQHHVEITSSQPGGSRGGGITGQRVLARGRRQRLEQFSSDLAITLQEYATASAVDRNPQLTLAQVRKRIGQSLAHRHPNHRYAGGKRKPVRKGKTGADAGEAPWA